MTMNNPLEPLHWACIKRGQTYRASATADENKYVVEYHDGAWRWTHGSVDEKTAQQCESLEDGMRAAEKYHFQRKQDELQALMHMIFDILSEG